jgi:hypothetical protein
MDPARAAGPTAADGHNYLLAVVIEGTQEEPAPGGLISAMARYGDWREGEFAVESEEMTLLDLRLDYPEPEVLAKMPLKKSWSARAPCIINEGVRCCSDERLFEGLEAEGCRCRRLGHPQERGHKDLWRLFADHRTLHQAKERRRGSRPKPFAWAHADYRGHRRAKKGSVGAA